MKRCIIQFNDEDVFVFCNAYHKPIVGANSLNVCHSPDLVYLWRVNILSCCLVLALSSIFRSLPLFLLGLRREKALHFLHLCLPVSLIYVPSRGCCHSPLLPLLCPFTPAFICLAVSLCLRKLETAGNRQADRRRETEITLGFSNSVVF